MSYGGEFLMVHLPTDLRVAYGELSIWRKLKSGFAADACMRLSNYPNHQEGKDDWLLLTTVVDSDKQNVILENIIKQILEEMGLQRYIKYNVTETWENLFD